MSPFPVSRYIVRFPKACCIGGLLWFSHLSGPALPPGFPTGNGLMIRRTGPEDGHETMSCRLLPLPFSVRCVYDIRCIENRVIGNGRQPSCFRPGIPFPMDFRQKAVRS